MSDYTGREADFDILLMRTDAGYADIRLALVDALEPFEDGEPFDAQEVVDENILPALVRVLEEGPPSGIHLTP